MFDVLRRIRSQDSTAVAAEMMPCSRRTAPYGLGPYNSFSTCTCGIVSLVYRYGAANGGGGRGGV
jgi:hypothetical protein